MTLCGFLQFARRFEGSGHPGPSGPVRTVLRHFCLPQADGLEVLKLQTVGPGTQPRSVVGQEQNDLRTEFWSFW